MAPWLRTLAGFPKDLSSVPRSYAGQRTAICNSSMRGSDIIFCPHMHLHAYTQRCTYTHRNENENIKKRNFMDSEFLAGKLNLNRVEIYFKKSVSAKH